MQDGRRVSHSQIRTSSQVVFPFPPDSRSQETKSCPISITQLSACNSNKPAVVPTDTEIHCAAELPRLPRRALDAGIRQGSLKPKGKSAFDVACNLI